MTYLCSQIRLRIPNSGYSTFKSPPPSLQKGNLNELLLLLEGNAKC